MEPNLIPRKNGTHDIPTQVKNPDLVDQRRRQIATAAAKLFVKQGFHKTTTRQMARAAGVSVGSLYEYFPSKEDILYQVCHTIHVEVERGVSQAMAGNTKGREALAAVIREYFQVCHRMSDVILLIYQETQSLPEQWQKRVLENELRLTGLFVQVLVRLTETGDLPEMDAHALELAAHNISVLGHMWTFRRWFLSRHYTIEDYTRHQTDFIVGLLGRPGSLRRSGIGSP